MKPFPRSGEVLTMLLQPGQTLRVQMADEGEIGDGFFLISYGDRLADHVTVEAELADTAGRDGLIYDEDYSSPAEEVYATVSLDETAPVSEQKV